jgi:hypothetical protein
MALADAGLTSNELKETFEQDENAIQLINISDDPSLASCLIYFLKDGTNTVGSDSKSTLLLNGLGVG